MFTATAARAPGADHVLGLVTAADLRGGDSSALRVSCADLASVRHVELLFETVTADPDPEVMRDLMTHGARRAVDFDWNSATGELSYRPRAELMLPAGRASAKADLSTASCESR